MNILGGILLRHGENVVAQLFKDVGRATKKILPTPGCVLYVALSKFVSLAHFCNNDHLHYHGWSFFGHEYMLFAGVPDTGVRQQTPSEL